MKTGVQLERMSETEVWNAVGPGSVTMDFGNVKNN